MILLFLYMYLCKTLPPLFSLLFLPSILVGATNNHLTSFLWSHKVILKEENVVMMGVVGRVQHG